VIIRTSRDGETLTVTLDRPEARNALNGDGYRALDAALRKAASDDAVKVVLITGTAGYFCAGQDLKETASMTFEENLSTPFYAFIENLGQFGKPIVAAVDGVAVGVGITMLLHMDFVVASPGARFRTPFVGLGSTAEAGSSLMLTALVGSRMAARMLYLGDWLTAAEAEAAGLVSFVSEEAAALPAARALCERLCQGSAASLSATRRLLVAARSEALAAAFIRERAELACLLMAPDTQDRLAAFSDRRTPVAGADSLSQSMPVSGR
jgi:enoyl-CoA hydratase/carnithine racemase